MKTETSYIFEPKTYTETSAQYFEKNMSLKTLTMLEDYKTKLFSAQSVMNSLSSTIQKN